MKNTIEVINGLKKNGLIKDYAIGGAIGVLKWVEPFFTRDLDVFIILPPENKKTNLVFLTPIFNYLEQKGYKDWVEQWIVIEGIPVEFIPAEELAEEAVENAVEAAYEEIKTKVMTPEYLIALLTKAGRDKDIIKIRMLLEQIKIDREKLENILTKYNLGERFRYLIREK